MTYRLAVLRSALITADLCSVLIAFVLVSRLRHGAGWPAAWQAVVPAIELVVPIAALLVVGAFRAAGLYQLHRKWSLRRQLVDLAKVGVVLSTVGFGLLYLFDVDDVSRLFVAAFLPSVGALVTASRAAALVVIRRLRASGHGLRHVVVVGGDRRAAAFVQRMEARPEYGVKIVGVVADRVDRSVASGGAPLLAGLADLPRVLAERVVDEVAICLPFHRWETIEAVVRTCELQGKAVAIPVDLPVGLTGRSRLERVGDLPVLALPNAPDQTVALIAKRVADVALSGALLLALAPLLALVALAVLVTEGRPILYRSPRAGLHGRFFRAWKFRTMVRDADARLAQLRADSDIAGPAFKMTRDPRVTAIGALLRATSIDELPQLLNVLRGDMSLVGPRPPTWDEAAAFTAGHRRKLSVRPGLTGLWQITARNSMDFDQRLMLDLQYVSGWSPWLDVRILARTLPALVRSPGT